MGTEGHVAAAPKRLQQVKVQRHTGGILMEVIKQQKASDKRKSGPKPELILKVLSVLAF